MILLLILLLSRYNQVPYCYYFQSCCPYGYIANPVRNLLKLYFTLNKYQEEYKYLVNFFL